VIITMRRENRIPPWPGALVQFAISAEPRPPVAKDALVTEPEAVATGSYIQPQSTISPAQRPVDTVECWDPVATAPGSVTTGQAKLLTIIGQAE